MILDLNAAASGNVLGYNHYSLKSQRQKQLFDRFVTHKLDISTVNSQDMADIIREDVMASAPEGLYSVSLNGTTATQANEAALKAALEFYAAQHGADAGSLSVLGFNTSHHGSSKATLSASSDLSNPQEEDTFNWPKAAFPQWKYPFAEHEHYNLEQEAQSLQNVRDLVE